MSAKPPLTDDDLRELRERLDLIGMGDQFEETVANHGLSDWGVLLKYGDIWFGPGLAPERHDRANKVLAEAFAHGLCALLESDADLGYTVKLVSQEEYAEAEQRHSEAMAWLDERRRERESEDA
jgi:hypothetical protein